MIKEITHSTPPTRTSIKEGLRIGIVEEDDDEIATEQADETENEADEEDSAN